MIRIKLEYWSRVNTFFLIIAFVLLGFSVGIKAGRGDGRNSGAIGLVALVLYYILFLTLISFSRKGQLSPFISVFLPTAVLYATGIYYYRKLDWIS
jgi:lipopolysaccharide export LptBFGC system permease protein LptF